MHTIVHKLYNRHRTFWTREHLDEVTKVLGFFVIALIIQHVADTYVQQTNGVGVGDLILSHIPSFNIDFIIVQGALILTFVLIGLLLWKPKYLMFTGIAISMFVIVRSFFISLTHLGISPHQITFDTQSVGFWLYNFIYNSSNDFFFSGHTGAPFLMGLIFIREKFWGKFFFGLSFVFGVAVLLGHIHYSIDVFAAPFMTYGIFTIAKKMFPKTYAITLKKN